MMEPCMHVFEKTTRHQTKQSSPFCNKMILDPWVGQEAYGAAASLSKSLGWSLWYMRPKCHMMMHLLPGLCSRFETRLEMM